MVQDTKLCLETNPIPARDTRRAQTKPCVSGATLGIIDKMEARSPAPSTHSAGTDPGMKELGLVILTCLFLSSAELTEKEY